MEWDRDTLRRTLERSDARRIHYRQLGDPTCDSLVKVSSYHARVDDPRVMWVYRVNPWEDTTILWRGIRHVAEANGCATISCHATDRLTPSHLEQSMVDAGFTLESEGHTFGADVSSLERLQPQLSARPVLDAENSAAALQISTELWGPPVFGWEEAAAASEVVGRLRLSKRTKLDVVIRIEERPVGLAHLDVHAGVGTLEDAATLPAFQRKGAYSAAVDARIWLARITKCRQVLAHTESDVAGKVLQSRGLEVVDATRLYTLTV